MVDPLYEIFAAALQQAPTHEPVTRDEIWAEADEEPERTDDETVELEQRYDAAVERNQRQGRRPRRA